MKQAVLVTVFLAAVVVANLITTHVGAPAIPYVAFGLIGLDLITRDRLSDVWGTTRWPKMLALILVGGAISYWFNRDAATIAVASTIAFLGSEALEAVAYHLMRRLPWSARAPRAAMVGAIADSVLFVTIAFGFNFEVVFLQVCAKVAGAVFWTWVLSVTRPPVVAPEIAPEGAAA